MESNNSDARISRDEFIQRMKNAIWTCQAFNFATDNVMKYINNGLLGYQTDKDGTEKIDKNTNKSMPVTISKRTFFRYKKDFSGLPQVYKDLKNFAQQGYIYMMMGFLEELKTLHQLSVQNLLNLNEPLERQQVIDSIIKNVIPTQSAFADILKKMIESNMLKPEDENKDKNKK